MPFQNHFFNPDGTPYSPKVSDLFLPEPLGYTYDPTIGVGPVVGGGAPTYSPIDNKLNTIFASTNIEATQAPGIATFVAAVNETATAAKPLDVPVKVDANQVGIVARYRRPSTGTEMVDPGKVRAQLAGAPRALCFIRDIAVAKDANTQYRVFVDCDYLSASTPITDRHYVGTFGFFGTQDHAHGGEANPSSWWISPCPSSASTAACRPRPTASGFRSCRWREGRAAKSERPSPPGGDCDRHGLTPHQGHGRRSVWKASWVTIGHLRQARWAQL